MKPKRQGRRRSLEVTGLMCPEEKKPPAPHSGQEASPGMSARPHVGIHQVRWRRVFRASATGVAKRGFARVGVRLGRFSAICSFVTDALGVLSGISGLCSGVCKTVLVACDERVCQEDKPWAFCAMQDYHEPFGPPSANAPAFNAD